MAKKYLSLIGLSLPALFLPSVASALTDRSITVNTGVRITIDQLFANIYGFAAGSIVPIATLLFLVGAAYVVASHGGEEGVGKGKKIMRESLIGMGIVLGAYGIIRTLFAILY